MRLINADKLHPDCMTKDGKLAISQSQIANAPTVVNEYTKGFADGERSGRHFPLTDEEKGILVRQWLPQGEWIFVSRNCWKCPYCQELTNEGKNFCPNCGASMMKGGTE